MSEQAPTPEQVAAVEWLRAATERGDADDRGRARTILDSLDPALTNPQPAIPHEPGVYLDANGDVWWLKEGSWHDEFRSWPDSYVQRFAPFTRLVPERPPITREQIGEAIEAWGRDPGDVVLSDHMFTLLVKRSTVASTAPWQSVDAERLAEVLFDAEHGNGSWLDHTGDAVQPYFERAQYVIERLAELEESDR